MADLSFFMITGGHLQLHDVMYEFLRSQLDEPSRTELAGLLLDLLSPDLTVAAPTRPDGDDVRTAWWEDGLFAEYVGDNVVLHMMEAGRQQEAEALVCDLRWVLHRLQTSGTTSVLDDLDRVRTDRALQLSGAVKRIAHMLGGATVRPDAAQFLLNALREEPEWAQQAIALQRERSEPMLVSRWPLPDNPGPALRHVYKIPSSTRHNDAVALSPDGSWLAMAGDSGLFIVDTTTRLVTAAYRSDLPIDRIAIAPDGRIATLAIAGTITVHDAATGAVIAQGHDDGALWSIAIAPDGASLVTTGNDGRVKLWDARTGDRLRGDDFDAFPWYSLDDGHPSIRKSSVAVISGDGEGVVSGGARQVLLWSMPDGRPLAAFNAEPYGVSGLIEHVAVAPDRSWVAGSSDRKIYVWNTETGELTTTLEARGTIMALAVTRDGSHLASGDSEGALFVWESQRFTLKARLHGHGGVRSLGFSPDGQLLYSGGGGDARAWELRKATSLGSSEESTPVERVIASPAGTWVAVAVQGGNVHIRNAASGRVEATLTGHRTRVRNIAVAPDGTWLATEWAGTIFVWDTTGWTLTNKFYVQNVTGEIIDIVVSADSRRLFTVDHIAVRAWDPESGKPLISMASCLEEAEALSFSHDGSWLAGGDYYGTIWVWQAESGDLHSTLGGGYLHGRLRALAAMPGNTLLAYPAGGPVETWDIQRAMIVNTSHFSRGHAGTEVAISPDGMTVITCGEGIEENTVKRYDLDSSEERVVKRDNHVGRGTRAALAFSGDGRWFAVGGSGGTQMWERSAHHDRAEVERRPNDHLYGWTPQAIALTFHGDRLASARQESVVIWDTSTSEVVRHFTLRKSGAYTYCVSALAFSPDGRRLGIADGDRITILDVTSGDERELTGNLGAVQAAATSPEGLYVAIAGSDGVRVWDARNGRAIAVLQGRRRVNHMLFGPHEGWLAVAGDSPIEIFSLPQAERLKRFVVPHMDQESIGGMVATPDAGPFGDH